MRHFNLRIALALLAAAAAATGQQPAVELSSDGLSAPDPAVSAGLRPYLQARSAELIGWLQDGSLLIATRFGDVQQVHRVRSPLGMREQLSFAADGVAAAAARPYASDAFAYLEPLHGGESSRLYLQRLSDRTLIALTDGSHRDGAPLWAHDGKRIAFASNRGDGSDVDVYVLDTSDPAATPRLIAGGAGNRWRPFDWSLDDKRLLLGRDASAGGSAAASDSELYIAALDGGEPSAVAAAATSATTGRERGGARSRQHGRAAAPAPAPLAVRFARFAQDGRGLLVLTRHAPAAAATGSAALRLGYVDFGGTQWRDLSSDTTHDVDCFDRSIDGRYVAYSINQGGNSRLMLIDQQRRLDLMVPSLPPGVIGALQFDPSGQQLALSIESVRSPRDVYVLDVHGQQLTRWTQSETGPLDADGFVLPQMLRFPTWDRVGDQRRELAALIYRPTGMGSAPRPVLLLLCGGGGRQCRPGFDPFVQWLVRELGAVVVAPNVRGSGADGADAPIEEVARDVGSLLVWIDLQRDLDRERVALLGEGFGAALALQSLVDYGDRLRGAVAAFPPSLSALANAAAIRRPVLLVQGLNNPQVPAYQLEQLRARLRTDGVDARYLAAADEGAGFRHASHRDAYLDAAANFIWQLLGR